MNKQVNLHRAPGAKVRLGQELALVMKKDQKLELTLTLVLGWKQGQVSDPVTMSTGIKS